VVELEVGPGELRLAVDDDGTAGAPPTVPIRLLTAAGRPPAEPSTPPAPSLGGNGLIGMRERAASCGGTLTIGTSPLGGWAVIAILPA
jgi:signal transduction histidine kinase